MSRNPLRYDDAMTPPQQAEDKASTHAITIRLPEDLYEDLRRQAYEQRTSINALIVEALRTK
jgi:predicted HicB family RNase H-like nuclease